MNQRGNWLDNVTVSRKGYIYTVKRVVTKHRGLLFWRVKEHVHYEVIRVNMKTKEVCKSSFSEITDELHLVIENPSALEIIDHFDSNWDLDDILKQAFKSATAA